MKIQIVLLESKQTAAQGHPLIIEITHKGNRKTTAYGKLHK